MDIHRPRAWAHPLRFWAAAATALALTACGGGSDSGPATTELKGVAATGAPIVGGTVEVRCAGGSVLTTTTAGTGAWQLSTTGQTLPCAVRVTGGNLPSGAAFHSVALSFGNTNITPLTDLIVANMAGKTPTAWWGTGGPTDFSAATDAKVSAALTKLRAALGLAALQTVDPRTATFTAAAKDAIDDVLEALQAAIRTAGIDYGALLAAAVDNAFTLSSNFRTTLANAHVTITANNGGSTGGTGGTGGAGSLTVTVSVAGVQSPAVTIANVPKPANQSEFCAFVNDPASSGSLSQVAGTAGTFTITGCSFNGTTGTVAANLSTSGMSLAYNVSYTYN